jgi:uncharacterized protein (DUF169 family)
VENAKLAHQLVEGLRLERPPVALAFVATPPEGVAGVDEPAPSACTFWLRAEQGVFYATAKDHRECPIGVMTMGFPVDASAQTRGLELIGKFVELDYFSMDEVAHLPSVKKPHAGVLYGPLAEFPIPPEVVLVVASPFQSMVLAESGGTLSLGEVPQLAAMGRPACAAIPRALASGVTTMSLGCIGARTYAEIPDDRAVLALPVDRVRPLVERLKSLVHANDTLGSMHREKRAQFSQAGA